MVRLTNLDALPRWEGGFTKVEFAKEENIMQKNDLRDEIRRAFIYIGNLMSLAKKALDNLEAVEELYLEVEKYTQEDETLKTYFEQEKGGNLTMLVYDYRQEYPEFRSKAKKSDKISKCVNEKLTDLLEKISNLLSDIRKCGMDMQITEDVIYIVDHIEYFGVMDILLETFFNLQEKIESLEFAIDETKTLYDGFPDYLYDENGDFRFDELEYNDFDD